MKIPMTDLKANYVKIKSEINEAVQSILNKTNFVLGEEVRIFEEQFSKYCGTKYAIGVANGTDAIKIALMAAGVKEGDEVITTPCTFVATAESIVHAHAKPVFSDINLDTFCLDPEEIEKNITEKTRAIVPVHLYGHPCEMDKILKIAKKHNLIVIEDCAQSFTAKYKNKMTGSIGNAGCFSFFPAKNMGCFGDGGAITTNDDKIYENIKMLRNHGGRNKNITELHGFNSRLDTIQASVLLVKLKYIDQWTKMRNEAAQIYNNNLNSIVKTPTIAANCSHSFNYYTIFLESKEKRNGLMEHLKQNGIGCQIYYPLSLHLQNVYKSFGYKKGDFPNSEKIQDLSLSLPMYPELKKDGIDYISEKIKGYISK